MKLIKIGKSPSCDIVLHDPYVSALHAEVTVLDNGEIFIEDKNSSNGTFVATNKINPNTEVKVHRGDHIRLANTPLPWARIPQPPKVGLYKRIVNIGSNFRNELVITNETVSRYHATLKVDKKGRSFICDNGSRNGTTVNGQRIQANEDVRIKKGDLVTVAMEDITEQINMYLPSSSLKTILIGVASVCAAAIIAGLAYIFWPSSVDPASLQTATVYLQTGYHYNITIGDETIRFPLGDECLETAGTGFFLDKQGRIGTARHVAVPWDEAYAKEEKSDIENQIKAFIRSQIPVYSVTSEYEFRKLNNTEIGKELINQSSSLPELNANIASLYNANVKIEGEIDYILVGFNGNNYERKDEFKRCTLVGESGDAKKDVAILQMNDKTTPANISTVFNINKIDDKPVKPAVEQLITIGFPYGFLWSYDSEKKQISNSIKKTTCSKEPSRYNFEFQASSQPGASGSPVFKENGQLVGVVSAVHDPSQSPTIAAHAIFLKELYDKCTSTIAKGQ